MKKFISDNFMSIVAVVGATIVIAMINYHAYSVIMERGGFEAWKATNPLWESALSYSFTLNLMYVIGMAFVAWLKYDERKMSRD